MERVCHRKGLSWLGFVEARVCCEEGFVCREWGLFRVDLYWKGFVGEKLRNPFLHTPPWPLLIRNVCCLVRAETTRTEGRKKNRRRKNDVFGIITVVLRIKVGGGGKGVGSMNLAKQF